MCGRYVSPDQAAAERAWHLGRPNGGQLAPIFIPRYNVAPEQGTPERYVPIIRSGKDGVPKAVRAQWWLLPFWSKVARITYKTFNARVETVATSASFRDSFKRRRCLFPVAGWYEWQQLPNGKQPWYIHSADGEVSMLAGLWDRWEKDGQVIESCSIVIGAGNEMVSTFHDRMPFVLTPDRYEPWLDKGLTDPADVMKLLQPVPDDALGCHRVSDRVNSSRNESSELNRPIDSGTVDS